MGLPNAFFGLAFFKTPFLGSKSGNKRALGRQDIIITRMTLKFAMILVRQISNSQFLFTCDGRVSPDVNTHNFLTKAL